MSARLMVLGIVSKKRKTHGYDVYREIMSWKADTWSTVRSGSIYHAFTQLEKEGFLRKDSTQKSKDGPAKTSYAITTQGETALLKLVETALVSLDQEEFSSGLAFMHLLSRSTVIELAEQRLKAYQDIVAFMTALPQEQLPTTPATHPEIIGSWSAIFTATTTWQRAFIGHLQAGNYSFHGENTAPTVPQDA